VMDRGYLDFIRLYALHLAKAFFVTRNKSKINYRRIYSRPVDKSTGLRYDQTIVLTGVYSAKDYLEHLRLIKFYDSENKKLLTFLTNNFLIDALTVAHLYKSRWKVELFFRWIKQHLRIKAFYGTSQNAVKTQVWIAISIYVLIAIIKKRLGLKPELYTILQILSVTIFDKTDIFQVLMETKFIDDKTENDNQLQLFNI
jgi:IS4 transposase